MHGGSSKSADLVVGSWMPPIMRWVVTGTAIFFLLVIAVSTSPFPIQLFRTARFFTQMSCLFPDASTHAIEYRVEAWSCAHQKWEELDYRTFFPLRPEDKENRFQRLGHFYRNDKAVLGTMEAYLMDQHNREGAPPDGIDGKIGGVRFMSLRIPIPPVGTDLERYRYKTLTEYPEGYRKYWYQATQSERGAACR
jgi:hypothetical protein